MLKIIFNKQGDGAVIVFRNELGERIEWSWSELRATVSRLQQALKQGGVRAGDRVAGIVPNSPYTIAASLATASLGGIWCSCSPDFGFNAAMDRINQINPKILFCADGYTYNGKTISCVPTIAELSNAITRVETTIVFPLNESRANIDEIKPKGIHWAEYIESYDEQELFFTHLDFNAPLYIMFSPGTTGLPKCILHSVGDTLLQHLKEHQLQVDIKPNNKLLHFTTCGWMMWNWIVSALGSGASVILYDSSPFYPDSNRLADIVVREKITHFGTSAKYLDASAKSNINPIKTHDLSSLRIILSTGSPLSDIGYDYTSWKQDVCLSSIAGDTDILGCFVGGIPISPVFRGECKNVILRWMLRFLMTLELRWRSNKVNWSVVAHTINPNWILG